MNATIPRANHVQTTLAVKGQQEISNKYAAQSYCSLANSSTPKANTGSVQPIDPAVTCLLRFNHLRSSASLAWQVPLLIAGTNSMIVEYSKLKLEGSGASHV